ncbi:hypothetical protein [Sandaracinus amylolyticus]|uniref:Lipoprotein n=1 Tax=Sandaracinus amylolyticus TaxID=927083 RepID=A0A0F6W5G2_9BACT|nr:hypothetical protein [Sandaracinus amylolyticus]AKF07796.1 hypothetical protein DB32_004945 [Sandaracinus amylolyticus]
MRALGCLLVLGLAACGGGVDPYCSSVDDPTGRGIALCRQGSETPVCDDADDTARWERSGGVVRLIGGTLAFCDEAREVVCTDRSTAPYCLPELRD